ncbi:putative major facilitator superfamily domain-containing protein [Lupinus albus]|uniref:Putative major facilitator superfamily domain-containing protein n=1 Tax=Lupinus albus TaxID=3870 RepID=A0A6A4ND97_LUPAL|nr:putative major facilitator superfamily domain-containing protein [Lupinus albus]
MVVAEELRSSVRFGGWRGMKWFSHQVVTGRYFMVFASLLIMSVAGATYMFGLYSNDVKTSLGYDQSTLNLLSFFKDLGGNVGVLSGLVNEITPPWVVLSIGAIMNFFGYFMIYLAVTSKIPKPKLWQMCLYICIGANSQSFANTGALVTCVKNFPSSRGNILGLLKGYVGLSGAIITQLYHTFYGDHNSKALILLIAWLPAAISFVFLPTIRILNFNTTQQSKEIKVFYNLLYISLGLAGFLMVLIIIQNKLSFPRLVYIADGMVVVFLLLLPLAIVFREEFIIWKTKFQGLSNQSLKVVTEVPPQDIITLPQPEQKTVPESTTPTKTSCFSNMFKPPNRVTGYLYDKEALKQLEAKGLTRHEAEDLSCLGVQCYRMSFIIITVSTLVGCFVSFILVLRTRKFYKGDMYRKFRMELEAAQNDNKNGVIPFQTDGHESLSCNEVIPETTTK